MNEKELKDHLLKNFPKENDGCEWKEFKNLKNSWSGRPDDDVISYVSAISNINGGHLVIGVKDGTLDIVGILDFHNYTLENVRQRLAGKCPNLSTEKLSVETITTSDTAKTVWIIHVPRHEPRKPVYAHDKAYQRLGECLIQLRPERLEAIISEPIKGQDWSAGVIDDATISDLDPIALKTARIKYKIKSQNESWIDRIDGWSAAAFLDKAKLTADGKITRAALLLLGKAEAAHFLSPQVPQITWKLDTGEEKAYAHFEPPFIITTTKVLTIIRNPAQKLFSNNQLLAIEIPKYESRTILEGLHNCLAHQDYERGERILVTETADRLVFENAGGFVDGEPEDYFTGERTPRRYRNRWLADAMILVGMIDTVGYGIHTMTKSQRERFLPLPGYGGSTPLRTKLEVLGRPIDVNYTQMLLQRRDLDLDTVIQLDRVQKGWEITTPVALRLRREGLIEGRKPHFHVSATIAAVTETEATYSRNKGLEKTQLKDIIVRHLRRFQTATRPKLDELLIPMLPSLLSDEQKTTKVKNLLAEMKTKDKTISSQGKGPRSFYKLADK